MTPTPVSNFLSDEIIKPAYVPNKFPDCLKIEVPIGLPERRIYVYLEINQTAAGQCLLQAEIQARIGGSLVGSYPASIADFTGVTPNASSASLFSGGGTAVGDSLTLTLAAPFNAAITQVVLQPLRINAEIDRLTLNILGFRGDNVAGFRAYLACMSTQY